MGNDSDGIDALYKLPTDDSNLCECINEDINKLFHDNIWTYDLNYNQSETLFNNQSYDSSILCAVDQYIDDIIRSLQSNEYGVSSNNTIHAAQLTTNELINKSLPVPQDYTENASKSLVHLSNQVAVNYSESKKLRIVYPLEKTYRARYKSDYFQQSGRVRSPRYIADCMANHYITLQLPIDYPNNIENHYIRVALITVSIKGQGHYYSPYKFQTDNTDLTVPDENPIYLKVDNNLTASATIQLQLVLIKSKLHELNYVQPLKLFSDEPTCIEDMIDKQHLPPKDLINKYQLDKSHLAFTLCRKTSMGSYQPDLESTVFSSIISETGPSKKLIESSTVSSSINSTDPMVYCPSCSHSFIHSAGVEEYQRNQNRSRDGKSRPFSKEDRKKQVKKKRKT